MLPASRRGRAGPFPPAAAGGGGLPGTAVGGGGWRQLSRRQDSRRGIGAWGAGFPGPAWHHAAMRFLAKLFLRGLVAILPLALTGYLAFAAVVAGETLLRKLLLLFLPEPSYWPGMGFLLSVALVLLIGLLMYSFVVRRIYARFTALLERIPVVKSIYGMLADVVRLFASAERPFRRVVLVTHSDGIEQLGFLTREDFADMPDVGGGKVAVYLPMSYQLGGFTWIVPRSRVREVAMSVEDALRFCVTAGVARQGHTGAAE